MYADDIILLSSTAEGLQAKLDILDSYCNDWCLTVNPTKTKILVFNKAGRHLRHKFKYKACELECVQHCKYLGVYFSASGTFSYAQDELYKKSLRAYFKLQKDFLSLSPKPKTNIHIFYHTIKPIVLYGCEIWGTFNSNTARFRNGTVSPDRIYSNLICEKLHTKFCKFILGVHNENHQLCCFVRTWSFPTLLRYNKKYFPLLEPT
jgi:hypothetical protein